MLSSFFSCSLAAWIAITLIVLAVPICIILLFLPAWYGRYNTSGNHLLGTLPARWAWLFQESPSFLIPLLFLLCHPESFQNAQVNIVCLAFYLFHYFYRSFIYPFRTKNGKRMPTEIFLMAIVFCILNGTVQAIYQITPCSRRSVSWFYDPRFIVGALLFVAGLLINWQSDAILRSLRADGSSGYKIPQGGMFTYVSGANYFGECVEWIGYACLSWNLGALAFAIFTIANVGPRAIQHHRWYKETFGDAYPPSRKAIIPFLLSPLC